MPIYEYRCKACHQKVTHFARSFSEPQLARCPHCGGSDLARLISTFAVLKTSDDGSKLPSYESLSDVDESDPKSMARWLKGMRADMGDEFGVEMEEDIARMEAGDMPEDMGESGDGESDDDGLEG